MIIPDDFVCVCRLDELKENEGKAFFVGNNEIALFKVDGKVYALDNICPHQHVPLIYDGIIEEGSVICPSHGWKFDLATGNLGTRKGLTAYEVIVQDRNVYVRPVDKKVNW